MADGVEKTVSLEGLFLASDDVLHAEVGHQAVGLLLTKNLGGNGVETDGNLGVGQEAAGHGLGSAELVAADKHGNAATVLGEEDGLLSGGITTADDEEGLVAEDGHGTIADSAGADTVLPVYVLTRKVETAGIGTSGNDDSISGAGRLVVGTVVPLSPQLEGPLRKVDAGDSLGDDLSSEADGLLAHGVHQLRATNSVRKTGKVLDISGRGKLATGSGAIGQHTLVKDRLEFRPREVDGGGVSGGAGADNFRGVSLLLFFFGHVVQCRSLIESRETHTNYFGVNHP